MPDLLLPSARLCRAFTTHFCALFAFLIAPGVKGAAVSPSSPFAPSSTGVASASTSFVSGLRLQGVAAIGDAQTAYFIDTASGAVIALRVGATLRGQVTLVHLENALDHLACRAVLRNESSEFRIGIADFMQHDRPSTPLSAELEEENEPTSSLVRVAVKPWVDPKTLP